MGYEDDYAKSKEKGKAVQVTRQIVIWDEEGQVLTGKVLEVQPFTDGIFETEVAMYIIETDNGIVSTVLGSATDKQLAKIDVRGSRMHIEYKGKRALKDGRAVNIFNVEVF